MFGRCGIFRYVQKNLKSRNFGFVICSVVKFIFSKKATKIDEIFNVDLTHTTERQITGEDFFKFCGLLRKYKL